MPNWDDEQEQLAKAEAHIARAEQLISGLEEQVTELIRNGRDASGAMETLVTLAHTLEEFRAHRALIVRTLDDIQAGRLEGDA